MLTAFYMICCGNWNTETEMIGTETVDVQLVILETRFVTTGKFLSLMT